MSTLTESLLAQVAAQDLLIEECKGKLDKLRAENERLREAARKLISAYMADDDLAFSINRLEAAAGLGQQGSPSLGEEKL